MSEVLRIAVYGPESTGKTELATKLAAHFHTPLVAEYARERWDAQGALTLEDMLPVALEQWRREDEAAQAAAASSNLLGYSISRESAVGGNPSNLIGYSRLGAGETAGGAAGADGKLGGRRAMVICDTDALTTMLWSDLLYGTTPEELRRGAERRCRNYALYLLLDIDAPFAPDPQRCFPDPTDREKAMRIWRGALERRGLPHVLIRGDWAARERAAIAAVQSRLDATAQT